MELQAAMLCNAAEIREGVLSVLGGGIIWLAPPAYPHPIGQALAGIARVGLDETGDHSLRVGLLDEIGGEWGHLDVTLTVAEDAFGVDKVTTIPFIVPLVGLSLPCPGDYELPLTIDGEVRSTLWLRGREA